MKSSPDHDLYPLGIHPAPGLIRGGYIDLRIGMQGEHSIGLYDYIPKYPHIPSPFYVPQDRTGPVVDLDIRHKSLPSLSDVFHGDPGPKGLGCAQILCAITA